MHIILNITKYSVNTYVSLLDCITDFVDGTVETLHYLLSRWYNGDSLALAATYRTIIECERYSQVANLIYWDFNYYFKTISNLL